MLETFIFNQSGSLITTDSPRFSEIYEGLTFQHIAGETWRYLEGKFRRAVEEGYASAALLQTQEGSWLVSLIPSYGLYPEVQRVNVWLAPVYAGSER